MQPAKVKISARTENPMAQSCPVSWPPSLHYLPLKQALKWKVWCRPVHCQHLLEVFFPFTPEKNPHNLLLYFQGRKTGQNQGKAQTLPESFQPYDQILQFSCPLGEGSKRCQCNSPTLIKSTNMPQAQIQSVLSQSRLL